MTLQFRIAFLFGNYSLPLEWLTSNTSLSYGNGNQEQENPLA
jgi:hypothetical protein